MAPNTAHITEHRVGGITGTLPLKHSPDASKVRGNQETSAWFVVTSEAKKPSACKFGQNMEPSPRSGSPREVKNTSAWLMVSGPK